MTKTSLRIKENSEQNMVTVHANRYEEIKFLGRGASSRVVLVKDKVTGIECALKIFKDTSDFLNQHEFSAFQAEFATLKNIHHPSVADVYDAGVDEYENDWSKKKEKSFYITTEYINGKNLRDATENKSVDEIENLFVQALRAFNYLHSKKILHLDIKPHNLLVKNENNEDILKVIDFGLSNFYDRKSTKEKTDEAWIIAGSAPYISPEIIKGIKPDGRSDLYSLACAFYDSFTKELPYVGKDQREFHKKHLTASPKIPSSINPLIPKYIDTLLLKMLKKNPDDRYQTAAEVISDINLLSAKDYPIETEQTKSSYLLKRGRLIGRGKEFEVFKNCYQQRLLNFDYNQPAYLIIKAEEGYGKTRFLQECKIKAQTDFIKTISWEEFQQNPIPEEEPTPTLVIGDEVKIEETDVEYIESFFSDVPIVFVFSTDEDFDFSKKNTLVLKKFSLSETKEFLNNIGLSHMPEDFCQFLFEYTNGNPSYLTELLRHLYDNNILVDKDGTWSPKIIEDLGREFETIGATNFIKKSLKEKIDKLKLNKNHYLLLYTMALFGKPTLQDINEMTGGAVVEEELEYFVKSGILEPDVEHRYIFSNPLLRDNLLEEMPSSIRADICDEIVFYLDSKKALEEDILYYKGRSHSPDAILCLIQYSKIQREQLQFTKAKENLLFLLNQTKATNEQKADSLLELSEIEMELGQYEKSEKYLHKILDYKNHDPLTLSKTYEKLGMVAYFKRDLDSSTKNFNNGLEIIAKDPNNLRWMEVILKGRIAQNEFDLGNMSQAENLLKKTWSIWKNDLTDEEKILAAKNNIDTLYYAKGEYQKAANFLEKYLEVISEKKHLDSYPIILYKLGRVYLKLKQLEKSEKYLLQCLELFKERRSLQWLYYVYNELGLLYELREDYKNALYYYKHAFDLAKKKNVGTNFYAIAKNIAQIYLRLGNYDEAEKYFNFVIRNLKNAKQNKDELIINYRLYMSYLGLTEIFSQKKKYKEAHQVLDYAYNLLSVDENLKDYKSDYQQAKADLLTQEKSAIK